MVLVISSILLNQWALWLIPTKDSIWWRWGFFWCLNKHIFIERKYNNIIERCSKNIYAVENKNYESLLWKFHGVFVSHAFCCFVEKNWLKCNFLSLWYFKLHCELYSTYFIQLKNKNMIDYDRFKFIQDWVCLAPKQACFY